MPIFEAVPLNTWRRSRASIWCLNWFLSSPILCPRAYPQLDLVFRALARSLVLSSPYHAFYRLYIPITRVRNYQVGSFMNYLTFLAWLTLFGTFFVEFLWVSGSVVLLSCQDFSSRLSVPPPQRGPHTLVQTGR